MTKMSNIMITDACNLNCSYCFANEFVNKGKNEISRGAFIRAANFILGDGSQSSVGLIGGEPTTHPLFEEFIRLLVLDNRAKSIVVYTNGLLIDRYFDILCNHKVSMLINCNAPEDIGCDKYNHLCENIDYLVNTRLHRDHITLGINMYKEDFSYKYIIDMLRRFGFKHVRISITVPNANDTRNSDAFKYFSGMKPRLLMFMHEALGNGIIPSFDCNKIPSCLLSDQELKQFDQYLDDAFIKTHIQKSNIQSPIVRCSPVIDIRQDLSAVRCFGLSTCTKQNIEDYRGIADLREYYINEIDSFAYNTSYSTQCRNCFSRKTRKCMGGCLAFKIADIQRVRSFAEKTMQEK